MKERDNMILVGSFWKTSYLHENNLLEDTFFPFFDNHLHF